jgi:hypothetical protein
MPVYEARPFDALAALTLFSRLGAPLVAVGALLAERAGVQIDVARARSVSCATPPV